MYDRVSKFAKRVLDSSVFKILFRGWLISTVAWILYTVITSMFLGDKFNLGLLYYAWGAVAVGVVLSETAVWMIRRNKL